LPPASRNTESFNDSRPFQALRHSPMLAILAYTSTLHPCCTQSIWMKNIKCMNNIRTEGNGWWWLRTLIRKAGLRESGKHFVQPSSAVSLLRGWSDGHDLCSANSIMILSEPTSLDYAYLNAVTLPRLISEPSLLLSEHTPHHADNFWLINIYRRSKEGLKKIRMPRHYDTHPDRF